LSIARDAACDDRRERVPSRRASRRTLTRTRDINSTMSAENFRSSRSDAETRALRDAEQSLAQIAHASAEIATMYKTLLNELLDRDTARDLTIAWIHSISAAGVLRYRAEREIDRDHEREG
jgi:hypothetical protein